MIDDDLTRKFFLESGSDQLRKIYLWARSRQTAPWALFGAVIPRVAACTPYTVQLPPIIGDYASLNVFCAFVAPSGGGKGKADRVSRRAWPAEIEVVQSGTGEAIAEMFTERKDKPRLDAAIITATEIDMLTGLASRQGSILMAELKSAWMGEQLGQRNAAKATSRQVGEHDYRLCLSVGAQFGHAGLIFADATGGSPQRFYWWPGTDPNMPEGTGDDPEPLDTTLPVWQINDEGVAAIAYDDPAIAETIRSNDLARNRGEGDALDGHSVLARCKLAALLGVMHQRQNVTTWDWEHAGIAMQVSDQTRDSMVEYDRQAARAKVRDRAIARAVGEDFYDASRLETVKRSLLRMLERDGEQAGNKLRSRLGKREKRDLFDQAIALLEADGLVLERTDEYNGAKRVRYRIGSGLTKEVTPRMPSSTGVTPVVRPDLSGTVTDLDSRRSHEPTRPKLSCQKWLNQYIEQLVQQGHTTVESFAVIEAGQAENYTKGSIHQAVSAHPDMRTVSRKRGRAIWSITPDQRPPRYESAAAWLDKWLDKQNGNTVSPEDAKLAGQAAGHPWQSVRRAAGLSPRINSVPAHGDAKTERVWHISDTPGQNEDAS